MVSNNLEKKLAIFDLDRTIINSDKKIASDVVKTFGRLGIKLSPNELYGKNWYSIAKDYGVAKKDFDKALDERESWDVSLRKGLVSMYKDAEYCLDNLKGSGVKLALLSRSNDKNTSHKIDYFNLKKYFESYAVTPLEAPSKEKEALDLVKKFPAIEKVYFIGDRLEDVDVSNYVQNKSGIKAEGLYLNRKNNFYDKAYNMVKSLKEVPEIILKNGK